MRAWTLVLIATSVGACVCPQKRAAAPPAQEPRHEQPAVRATHVGGCSGPLARPSDLGPEWAWNGQALPTGMTDCSVIALEKIGPAEVNNGAAFTYQIRVTNIAQALWLSDVVVTDHLPESGFDYASSDPACEKSGGALAWKVGDLGPGQSRTMSVKGAASGVGRLRECASVTYVPKVCIETNVVSAGLELQKFAPAEVCGCDGIPLRFVVRNPGNGTASNVRIVDQLPEGWTVNGQRTVTIDAGSLRGGEAKEFTAVAECRTPGESTNTATATADGGLSAKASAPTAIRMPKLAITKTCNVEEQILERDAVFTITVKNTGDWPAKDLVLRDSLSGAERVISASDGGTAAAGGVAWNLGTLAPGAERSVTLTVNRATAGEITNTCSATAYCAEEVTASARLRYRGIPAVLLEVVDDPDPVLVGSSTMYTIRVTNQGTSADSDIAVTCGIEDAVEFVSCGGATTGSHKDGTITFAALPMLEPKAVAVWTVVVKGVKVGDTRFKVSVQTKETGRPIEETEATRVYK